MDIEEYARKELIDFFKWNQEKVANYVEYLKKVKPIVTSREIEDALNIFETATIEERYDLYIKSKTENNA